MKTLLYISNLSISILFCCFFFILFTIPVLAQGGGADQGRIAPTYTPIVGIPGVDPNNLTTEGYLEALYYMSISIAALLTVYKILVGGIHWMFDGVITEKAQALKNIRGAIFGLLIVLSAVLILDTINVNLKTLNVLGKAPSLKAIEQNKIDQAQVVTFGSVSNSLDPAEMKRIADNCGESGGVLVRGVIPRVGESVGCYADPTTIDAKPGDILDISKYPPSQTDAVIANFKNSCNGADEFYSDSYGTDDQCLKTVPAELVIIGTTVDYTTISGPQLEAALASFTQKCEGPTINGIVAFKDAAGTNIFVCEEK